MDSPRSLGKYELVEKISEGGMGVLYRARTVGPGGFARDVALKVIRGKVNGDQEFVRMFIEEAKIASLLSHANLVHLYDFGSEGDQHYLCMELVNGRDLSKVLERCRTGRATLGVPFTVRIVSQVAEGLDYAHRLVHDGAKMQLVHRDVSPQNILVSFDGAVKLTDFGIARVQREQQLTRSGVIKGKLAYMAPEQMAAGVLDRRSDVFALGIVLWEALASRRLFGGVAEPQIVQRVMEWEIRPPSSLNADVPEELDRIALKALARNPRERWQSAREFAQALSEVAVARRMQVDGFALGREMRRLFPEAALTTGVDVSSVTGFGPAVSLPPLPAPAVPVERGEATPSTLAAATEADAFGRVRFYAWPALGAAALTALLGVGGVLWLRGRSAPVPAPALPAPAPAAISSIPHASPPPASPGAAAAAAPPLPSPRANELPAASPSPEASLPREAAQVREGGAVASSPSKPHPRKRPRPAGPPGILRVIGLHPWAEVIVDGQSRGFSPLRSLALPAGRHRIVLSNGEASIQRRFTVDVPPGKIVSLRGELRTLRPETEE